MLRPDGVPSRCAGTALRSIRSAGVEDGLLRSPQTSCPGAFSGESGDDLVERAELGVDMVSGIRCVGVWTREVHSAEPVSGGRTQIPGVRRDDRVLPGSMPTPKSAEESRDSSKPRRAFSSPRWRPRSALSEGDSLHTHTAVGSRHC
jgi:hypothetical protein